jgi:hypothetical protein
MRKALFLSFLIILSSATYSQKFTLSMLRSGQIAYVGVDNPLSCTVEGVSCKDISLATDNGRLTKMSCGNYIYRPQKAADSKIIIYKNEKDKNQFIGEFYLMVREIPLPTAVIGGLNNGNIIKKALQAQQGVAAHLIPSLGFDLTYMVTEFQLTIFRQNHILFSNKTNGNIFTSEMHEAFKNLEENDMILISSIIVLLPENKKVAIKPLELQLKN